MSGTKVFPRIKEVRAYTVTPANKGDQGADCHDVGNEHWIDGHPTPISNPMSMFRKYTASRKSWGINALGSMVVEVCVNLSASGPAKGVTAWLFSFF